MRSSWPYLKINFYPTFQGLRDQRLHRDRLERPRPLLLLLLCQRQLRVRPGQGGQPLRAEAGVLAAAQVQTGVREETL